MVVNVVEISENGRYISLYRGFLKVADDDGEVGRVPLDDIVALILSASQVSLSKNVMVALAKRNTPVVVCGKNWHPVSVTLPVQGHHDTAGILFDQIEVSAALRKRMWQALVREKIANQAKILSRHAPSHKTVNKLTAMVRQVRSGDPDNREAQAAQIYWPALMGQTFRRDFSAADQNALLNYGYTVLRAATARAVCGAGLHPALGVHHRNRKNPFCLVDDLMEPFRPLMDDLVLRIWQDEQENYDGLTPAIKRRLAEILTLDLESDRGASPLVNCLGRLAVSLRDSIQNGENRLLFPRIVAAGQLV